MARQSLPTVSMQAFRITRRVRLAVSATALAALCGVFAFIVLVLHDHGHANVMVNEQAAPHLIPRTATASSAALAATHGNALSQSPSLPAPVKTPDLAQLGSKHDFSVGKNAKSQLLGTIKIKLISTDTINRLYDVYVSVGRKWYAHHQLKINEPLWISSNRGANSIQMVVTSIEPDGIAGYWTESNRSTHLSPRIHSRRRHL